MTQKPRQSAASKMTERRVDELLEEMEAIVSELKKRNVDVNTNGKNNRL